MQRRHKFGGSVSDARMQITQLGAEENHGVDGAQWRLLHAAAGNQCAGIAAAAVACSAIFQLRGHVFAIAPQPVN